MKNQCISEFKIQQMKNSLSLLESSTQSTYVCKAKFVLQSWCPIIGPSGIQVFGLLDDHFESNSVVLSCDIAYILNAGRWLIDKNQIVYELIGQPRRHVGLLWAKLNPGAEQQLPSDKFFDDCSVSLPESWPALAASMDDTATNNDDEGQEEASVPADSAATLNSGYNNQILNEVTQQLVAPASADVSGGNPPVEQEFSNEANDDTPTVKTPPMLPLGAKMAKRRAALMSAASQNQSPTVNAESGNKPTNSTKRRKLNRTVAVAETTVFEAPRRESHRQPRQCQLTAASSPLVDPSPSTLSAMRRRHGFYMGGRSKRRRTMH